MKQKLFLISTPIGNYDDITIRALNLIKETDLVVCEEYKQARRFLSHFNLKKELFSLNEHTEKEHTDEVIDEIKSNKKVVLISDCGTPLFSDPGHHLVDMCILADIQIVPVPGASSLMAALVGSNLDFEQFFYYGWLSPKKHIRRKEFLNLKKIRNTLVVMETPYRLRKLLSEVQNFFGPRQQIVLAYKLTMPEERFYRGEVGKILEIAEEKKLKGEFVLLIDNKVYRK